MARPIKDAPDDKVVPMTESARTLASDPEHVALAREVADILHRTYGGNHQDYECAAFEALCDASIRHAKSGAAGFENYLRFLIKCKVKDWWGEARKRKAWSLSGVGPAEGVIDVIDGDEPGWSGIDLAEVSRKVAKSLDRGEIDAIEAAIHGDRPISESSRQSIATKFKLHASGWLSDEMDSQERRVGPPAKKPERMSSIYTGVTWVPSRQRWMVSRKERGRTKFIGYFKREIDAARAWDSYNIANPLDHREIPPTLNFPIPTEEPGADPAEAR